MIPPIVVWRMFFTVPRIGERTWLRPGVEIARVTIRRQLWLAGDPLPALTQYVQRMKMNYPILIGQGRDDVLKAFGPMPGLPTTVIIGVRRTAQ